MYFNAQKCVYAHHPKQNPVLYSYTFDNTSVQQVSLTKYLRRQNQYDPTWSTHINSITSKALSTKAFLQGNLKSCPAQEDQTGLVYLLSLVVSWCCSILVLYTLERTLNSWNKFRGNLLDSLRLCFWYAYQLKHPNLGTKEKYPLLSYSIRSS